MLLKKVLNSIKSIILKAIRDSIISEKDSVLNKFHMLKQGIRKEIISKLNDFEIKIPIEGAVIESLVKVLKVLVNSLKSKCKKSIVLNMEKRKNPTS